MQQPLGDNVGAQRILEDKPKLAEPIKSEFESNLGTLNSEENNIYNLSGSGSEISDENFSESVSDDSSAVSGSNPAKNSVVSGSESNGGSVVSGSEQKSEENFSVTTLSEEIINEELREAIESRSPKKRKKTTILSVILLLVNIAFMAIIVSKLIVQTDDFSLKSLVSSQGVKLWWLVGGFATYALFIFVQVLAFRMLIRNLTGNSSWKTAYDVAVVGKYYDNVTPFAVGGQPMQIVALSGCGVGAGVSTGIPIIKLIINTAVSALLAIIFFVVGLPRLGAASPLNQLLLLIVEVLGVIGLIITVLLAIFMLLISSGTLFTRSFISGLLRIGYKLRLIKNYRKTYRKVINQVAEYKFCMKYLAKNKKLLFSLIFLTIAEYLSVFSYSLFAVCAFSESIDVNFIVLWLICMTKYNLCQMASCFIPLPGGTGLMEISFIILFGSQLGSNIIWGLLGWRFLSYYLIIIHGFIHELVKIISSFVKNRKSRKLAAASDN